MVAHNKNYKSAPKPLSKPARNPRCAEPKDEVSHLWESDLICDLADPSNSLEDLCASRGISLEALSLWMARPDVAQRLDLVQTTAMNRARFIGRLTLPTAAQSAANIINAHKLRPQKPTIDSAFDSDLHRANETMLKAARFLQRLSADSSQKPPPRWERGQGVGGKSPESRNAQPSTPTTLSSTQTSAPDTPSTTNAPSAPSTPTPSVPAPTRASPRSPRHQDLARSSRSRRNSNPRSTKARPRKPPRPQSRISASSAPTPPIPASISPQPNQIAQRPAPEDSVPSPRARASSPAPRAAPG